MATYAASALSLRKKIITDGLRKSGATAPETAKTLEEAGVINPDDFQQFTKSLVDKGVLGRTEDGKFWVKG